MRISDDIKNAVVFIGFSDPASNFTPIGTGFFLRYDGSLYIVTNNHIKTVIDDAPFAIRINNKSEGSRNIIIDTVVDRLNWIESNDKSVDLAIMPFNYDLSSIDTIIYHIPQEFLLTEDKLAESHIGVGDFCYAIGLFRLMAGKTRNIPITHTGNIALSAGTERIPVENWRNRRGSNLMVDGHLVELTNLRGLSGSPVLVRPSMLYNNIITHLGNLTGIFGRADLFLLGVWQGSWDAKPGYVMALEHGQASRIPVGMGIVVPAARLIDLLESDVAKQQRSDWRKNSK